LDQVWVGPRADMNRDDRNSRPRHLWCFFAAAASVAILCHFRVVEPEQSAQCGGLGRSGLPDRSERRLGRNQSEQPCSVRETMLQASLAQKKRDRDWSQSIPVSRCSYSGLGGGLTRCSTGLDLDCLGGLDSLSRLLDREMQYAPVEMSVDRAVLGFERQGHRSVE